MFDLIASLLSFFYDLNGSYAIAIALLTTVVLVVSTPLTLSGTRSMLKMQVLQPELKAIQNKYDKSEREEMNKELMAFYQENNINPVGGCLPLLFQIPVFLVLYRVILGLTRRSTIAGSQIGDSVGSLASDSSLETVEIDAIDRNFNPAYLDDSSQMFADLSSSNEMKSFGFDLARAATEVVTDNFVDSLPYLLLVIVVGATGFLQHRMIRARQSGAIANPTQELIMKMMPWFLPIFAFTLPAAIVIYFLISNLYRIGQQYYITRSMYTGEDSLGAQAKRNREEAAKADKKSGKSGDKGGNKNGGKGGNNKGGGSAGSGAKKPNKPKGGGSGGAKKKSSGSGSRAPGRNSSGRTGSARSQVQPRGRKKKR